MCPEDSVLEGWQERVTYGLIEDPGNLEGEGKVCSVLSGQDGIDRLTGTSEAMRQFHPRRVTFRRAAP